MRLAQAVNVGTAALVLAEDVVELVDDQADAVHAGVFEVVDLLRAADHGRAGVLFEVAGLDAHVEAHLQQVHVALVAEGLDRRGEDDAVTA